MSRRLASTVPRHGCGMSRRSSSSRPATPNRSVTGHGCPKEISVAWMRCLSIERCLTRCIRKRACSRSRRTRGSGSQMSGTRSRCESTASTRASILSVLHASGARPLTLAASAISTSQPSASRRSCTNRAPVIDSITRPHRPLVTPHPARQAKQAVGIGRRRELLDDLASRRQQADIDLAATQIQSSVQHERGPPRARSSVNTRSVPPGRPSFMAVQSTSGEQVCLPSSDGSEEPA